MDEIECTYCNGGLVALEGQTIIITHSFVMRADGSIEQSLEPPTGWCGPCIAEWSERLSVD